MTTEGWIVTENRALGKRPAILGLSLGYAAMLIMASLFMLLVLHYVMAAGWLFFFGWSLGKLVDYYDPYAWGILGKTLKLPQRLVP